MHLRSEQVESQNLGCDFSDGEEDDEGYYVSAPPQFTTWGPYVQEFESIPICGPQSSLNPKAPEFRLPEQRATFNHSITPHESSDHVVIEIPESEPVQTTVVTDPAPVHDRHDAQNSFPETTERQLEVTCGEDHGELRRSRRERHPPPKFTYEDLGKPLIFALNQFFVKLKFFLNRYPVRFDMHAGTHAV